MDTLEKMLEKYPEFLTLPEVAEVLRIDAAAVRVHLRKGVLPGYQPTGHHWIVAKPDLIEHLRTTYNLRTREVEADEHDSPDKNPQAG